MTTIKNEGRGGGGGGGGGGDSDGDDDMSGPESQHSGFSHDHPDRDSSAEEADEPDSDDSSEMDGSECERRRTDCVDNLSNLERQFHVLREQLYRERLQQVETQLSEVRSGHSLEYLNPLKQITENMAMRTEVATKLLQYRHENINHKYLSEMMAADQYFESEKSLTYDSMREELLDKMRRLEEDRHNVDFSWNDWGTNTRTSKVRGPGRKKAVTVSGPYIVYMLTDEDIMEDWKIIRKSLKRSGTHS